MAEILASQEPCSISLLCALFSENEDEVMEKVEKELQKDAISKRLHGLF